jgi:hypothetical protein
MSRFRVRWSYADMTSSVSGINATDGVFGVTVESEWKAVPRRTFAQRLRADGLLSLPSQITSKSKFSMMGSLHKYFFDVRSTGLGSCHVAVADRLFLDHPDTHTLPYYMEFDLPTTSADNFAQELEKVGGQRAKHPYYDLEKQMFAKDVSLRGSTMRIAFHEVGN